MLVWVRARRRRRQTMDSTARSPRRRRAIGIDHARRTDPSEHGPATIMAANFGADAKKAVTGVGAPS